ncbi:putative phosphonate metabolism protein [Rhizobium sp. RU35A]|uniref:DUF1045 domain-containing protein n=1 Tax=Rhizobium sp. RU35A TaxID=1907414 RepID=UPI000956E63A|nr:DUF1045 domain-containing protein [Rhizobium sp. RU35A]SIR07336.1 putative phosphonate metabolism protein [Rhizobium sp. RU35A]
MRHAVYFAPPQDDPLNRAAALWLGRDAFSEQGISPPADSGLPLEKWQALTAEPRRYGFHATLKAPFTLSSEKTVEDLAEAFDTFCNRTAPVTIPKLCLAGIGPFFALVPDGDSQAIDALCAEITRAFEPFRAPLSPEDVARRKPERLTERQRALLNEWGYPYVFEEFRFHMTLTGPVPEDARPGMRALLESRFSTFIDRPLPIAHLGLFVEPTRGAPFRVDRHAPLGGTPNTDRSHA